MNREILETLLERTRAEVLETGHYLRAHTLSRVETKTGHANFVTDMDLEIQRQLTERLSKVLPEAVVVAEEQDRHPEAELCWIIDPIDGTTNYITGFRFSCISVALVQDDVSILGVVYDPYSDEMYYAAQGLGAFCNGKRISPSERPADRALVALGTSPYHTELADKTFRAARQAFEACADLRRSGSAALDLCYVACGRIDGYFEYILQPWDYAAGSCIVREAGARVEGIEKGWTCAHPVGIIAAQKGLWPLLYNIVSTN